MLLDLLVLVIIVAFTFLYYRIGFLKSLLGLCSGVISLIISFTLTIPISEWIMTTPFAESIHLAIEEKIKPIVESNNPLTSITPKSSASPVERFIQDQITEASGAAAKNINEYVSKTLTEALFKVIILFVVFVVLKIGLKFLIAVLDSSMRLPGLNAVNRSFGAVLGFFMGAIIVYISFAAIGLLGATQSAWLALQMEKSISSALFYNNNFIINILLNRR